MAVPLATGSIKNQGALIIVVYWISIKGFSPGRLVSTAMYGIIVVRTSEDGSGDRDGANVVGLYEGVAVGNILGEIDGEVEGHFVGFMLGFTEGIELGNSDGKVDVGNVVGTTVGL